MRSLVSGERHAPRAPRFLCWTAVAIAVLGVGGLVRPLAQAAAGDRLAGPIPAEVVAVIDGDTLEVRAHIWLGQNLNTRVRLAGIDAPELKGQCARERTLAVRARNYLLARLDAGDGAAARVRLRNIRYGKYAGRVLAQVETAAGEDLGRGLMAAGLARPYAGRARATWCDKARAPFSG